jgi:hypothetical protein
MSDAVTTKGGVTMNNTATPHGPREYDVTNLVREVAKATTLGELREIEEFLQKRQQLLDLVRGQSLMPIKAVEDGGYY